MNKHITPRAGLIVRRPDTGEILPPEGATIPLGAHRAYWLRRQKDGDVTMTDALPSAIKPNESKETD